MHQMCRFNITVLPVAINECEHMNVIKKIAPFSFKRTKC